MVTREELLSRRLERQQQQATQRQLREAQQEASRKQYEEDLVKEVPAMVDGPLSRLICQLEEQGYSKLRLGDFASYRPDKSTGWHRLDAVGGVFKLSFSPLPERKATRVLKDELEQRGFKVTLHSVSEREYAYENDLEGFQPTGKYVMVNYVTIEW